MKDAFKTAKGKFVVPSTIEDHFSNNDYIEQICVAGLGCPQPVALVNLSDIGRHEKPEVVKQKLEEELERINPVLSGHERISTIVVTKEPWTDANKLLTPTLKIRRGAINERYGEQIPQWHEAPEKIIWES